MSDIRKEALDAADKFRTRSNAVKVKKAALDVVAMREVRKLEPGDDNYGKRCAVCGTENFVRINDRLVCLTCHPEKDTPHEGTPNAIDEKIRRGEQLTEEENWLHEYHMKHCPCIKCNEIEPITASYQSEVEEEYLNQIAASAKTAAPLSYEQILVPLDFATDENAPMDKETETVYWAPIHGDDQVSSNVRGIRRGLEAIVIFPDGGWEAYGGGGGANDIIGKGHSPETLRDWFRTEGRQKMKQGATPLPPHDMGETDPEDEKEDFDMDKVQDSVDQAFKGLPKVPPAPIEPEIVKRDESATEAPHVTAPPPDVTPEPAEIAPAEAVPEAEVSEPEEGGDELGVRAEVETEITDPETIEAVMEFLKEEKFLGSYGLEVKEGVWGWREASNFATVTFGTREYMVAPSEEEAEKLALAMVRQQLEEEPDLFSPSFIESYINKERLRDALSSDVEEEVRESPDSYGWKPGTIRDEDEDEDEQLSLPAETEPSDEWVEAKVEELLKDPLDYLREIYGDETMKEAMRIAGINIDEAAEDAVAADGIGHFLSSYDGNINDLPSGGVWWRHN